MMQAQRNSELDMTCMTHEFTKSTIAGPNGTTGHNGKPSDGERNLFKYLGWISYRIEFMMPPAIADPKCSGI